MFITIPIEEGERWKFGEVTIEGNKIYPTRRCSAPSAQPAAPGCAPKLIDDGVKAISDLYHNTGYIFAHVEPELVEKRRPGGQRGHPRHRGRPVPGRPHRVRGQRADHGQGAAPRAAALRGRPGERRRRSATASLKVNQLGYFKLNEEDPVEIDTDSEKKKVNLTFKGEESDRTELQFGGGWSELDGFFGQFSVSTKNFLGRGEQVGVSVQTGKLRELLRPLLLDALVPRQAAERRHPGLQAEHRLHPAHRPATLHPQQQGRGPHLRPQLPAVPVGGPDPLAVSDVLVEHQVQGVVEVL